ncbi:MAG: hypothetical protein FWD98_01150 [Defluviitaleaceae bacterium]|nr:hypothetical protein [Defluviitaleaceae bacterium]
MPSEREIKKAQEEWLFDILMLVSADENERQRQLVVMAEKAKSGMTKEEIAEVRERVANASRRTL